MIYINDIINICAGKLLCGNSNLECTCFCTDTRKINKGDIYVGIKGESFNGNDFYKDAINNGASICVLDNDTDVDMGFVRDKCTIVLVDDTVTCLQKLAKYKRSLYNIPVVAVTGSVGKTSVKDIIASVLRTKYNVLSTKGNLNNHIGMPLTLLELNDEHEVVVVEMGMNHFGELHDLSKIANDFRLLDMLKEINLPFIQVSSTLNVRKNNPVIPEVVNQVSYFVYGTDATIAHAVEAAQLEYNPFQPIILYSLFEALTLIRRCTRTFRELCVEGLSVNKEVCLENVMKSNSIIAAFIPHIGYEKACNAVEIANDEERSLTEIIVSLGYLSKEKVDNIVNNENLTTPGIKG